MKQLISYAFILLALGMTACSGGGSEPAIAQMNTVAPKITQIATPTDPPELTSEEECPITQPQTPLFVPPEPYPATEPNGGFWYGTKELWTDFNMDGRWFGLPKSEAGYVNKIALWREDYSMTEEPEPEITLSAQQLDGEAVVEPHIHGTNAYHPDYGQFMMTGIELPALGCWEITAEYKEATLSFVVWVAP